MTRNYSYIHKNLMTQMNKLFKHFIGQFTYLTRQLSCPMYDIYVSVASGLILKKKYFPKFILN